MKPAPDPVDEVYGILELPEGTDAWMAELRNVVGAEPDAQEPD